MRAAWLSPLDAGEWTEPPPQGGKKAAQPDETALGAYCYHVKLAGHSSIP